MRTDEFHFHLPQELIAQRPLPERDASRLLVLHRSSGNLEHRSFRDLPGFLHPGDALLLNQSKVLPARLRATKHESGARLEILLLEQIATNEWWTLLKPGKRVRPGARLLLLHESSPTISAVVLDKNPEGQYRLRFEGTPDIRHDLDRIGETPLPPYIERSASGPDAEDRARYQTVFARDEGSVAAPTAGLHFTPEILASISDRGVQLGFVTLHVGPGTFAPVKSDTLEDHRMHREAFELPETTARLVNACRRDGRGVVAVGTTTLRVLETVAAAHDGSVVPQTGSSDLFVRPPFDFRVVDALLTNFHLPCSTLLMLVCAFADPRGTTGREKILAAYAEAIRERYRFYSYGDAMLIL